MTDRPTLLMPAPEGYTDWLAELKTRIHSAQQRAALADSGHATALPDDRLAALTLLLRQQVVALERERAARQQALAQTADLPDGVSANANTLRQARIDELRRLEREVADAEHALAQTADAAALKRWLNRQTRDQAG